MSKDYTTQREFKLEFQQNSATDNYSYDYRINLIEMINSKEVGLNQIYLSKDEYERFYSPETIKSLYEEYVTGDGPYVQKLDEVLFRDHGNIPIKYEGVQKVIDKYTKELDKNENDWNKEYEQLCIDWIKMFDLVLEQEGWTVEKYIKYLDNMAEIDLLKWAKRMVINWHECLLNSEYSNYSKLSKEEQEKETRSFIQDWLYSNDGWANGFFEADIFQEDCFPDWDDQLEVVDKAIRRATDERVDAIMKEHEEEIIEEIFRKGI